MVSVSNCVLREHHFSLIFFGRTFIIHHPKLNVGVELRSQGAPHFSYLFGRTSKIEIILNIEAGQGLKHSRKASLYP